MSSSNSTSHSQQDVLLASMQAILISNPDMMAAMQQFLTGQLPSYFVKVPGFGNVAPSKASVDANGIYSLPDIIRDVPKVSVPSEPMGHLESHLAAYLELVSKVKELKRVEADTAAKAQAVQDLEKSIENDRKWIEVFEQQEAQGVQMSKKSEGLTKITGKSDESNQHKLEDIRKEKATKEASIRETTAKLEKARIGLQLATSDASSLSIGRKDMLSLLEMALSTHSDSNYVDLVSALQEAKQLSDQVSRDTKTYRAAQSLCRSIYNNCSEILVQLEEVRKAKISWTDSAVRTGLLKARKCMAEVEEHRKLLFELIPGMSEKLPLIELQIPPLLLEFNSRNMTDNVSILQDFILRQNVEDIKKVTGKLKVLMGWLNNAVDSMVAMEAVAVMDLKGKKMQLNVFRMGCFEKVAVTKGAKPEAMGEAELTLLLTTPQ
ncbi:hypothetical protein HDU97_002684 [Phlyctochytrium planicorne]|nr:hypothetical protein HDU97_002684 [Phlyctochytrium planicorne]